MLPAIDSDLAAAPRTAGAARGCAFSSASATRTHAPRTAGAASSASTSSAATALAADIA